MKAFFSFSRSSLQWIALLAPLLFDPDATAAVTFTVTPATVSNTYTGSITLQIEGLNVGETVQIDKYLDANANGTIDASDLLVASFQLTDGQASAIGGVTNINVAFDSNPAGGTITASLNYFTISFFEHIVGKYVYRLSSPTGHFTATNQPFTVTTAAYAQSVTGTVTSAGTPLPNAAVLLFPANGSPVGGTVANNTGNYTLKGPPGSYAVLAFKANYVGTFSKTAGLTLNAGATITTNLNLTPATRTVTGKIVDAANPSLGLTGLMLSLNSANNLMAVAFMDTNGNFSAGVTSNQWQLGVHDESAAALGYLSFNNRLPVDTTTGNVSGVTVPLTKATALFYGTVTDAQSHQPLAGISVYDDDSNYSQYEGGWMTDLNGYYVVPAIGGVTGGWQISPDNSNPAFANYVFSQVNTNLSDGQAVRVDFVGVLGNHQISGSVKDAANRPIANVNVYAYTTDGSGYNANANTDATGHYTFNVVNGNWTVGVCCSGSSDCLSGLGGYGCVNEQTVNIANNNGTANFSVPLAPYHITGFVKDNNNNPLANVNVYASATINGTQYNQNGNADANGNYSLNVANGTWSVGICCSADYNNCLPTLGYQCVANQSVNIANNNGTANFTVYPASQSTAVIVVQPNPGNGGTVSSGGTYPVGSSQQISANPNNGWAFTGWNDSNTQNPRTIIVPSGGATYTANFSPAPQTATITVQASPSNGGTVSGGGTFNVGSSQSITAGANSGWTFAGWSDGGAQTHSVTVPATNITYTATFTQNGSIASPTFSGTQGLYDLTGGFTNLSASFITKDSSTIDISENLAVVQSVSGTLTSTGTLTTVTIRPSDSDSFSFPVTATFKGSVKSAGSNLQIAFAFTGQGSAVSDGSLATYKESVSYSVTVNPATGIETGKKSGTASKSGSTGGTVKIIDTTIGPRLFKFAPVGWYLSLTPTWNGTKVGGAATVYLTNGRSFPFTIKGTTKAGTSKLTLTGTGTGKGATLTVTMTGTNHISGISGSLLGQKFNRGGL